MVGDSRRHCRSTLCPFVTARWRLLAQTVMEGAEVVERVDQVHAALKRSLLMIQRLTAPDHADAFAVATGSSIR